MIPANPATGILYITKSNLNFISGHLRMRTNGTGRYPSNYIEMIDQIFGYCKNTIEVCSNLVAEASKVDCYTVDINPAYNPSCVDNAEVFLKFLQIALIGTGQIPLIINEQLERCFKLTYLI